jgi:flagellar protein FliO/FliZ
VEVDTVRTCILRNVGLFGGTVFTVGFLEPFGVVQAANSVLTNSTLGSVNTVSPQQFPSPWSSLINLVLALVVVLALVIFLIRFLSKRANVQSKGSISVLAARQLAPNRSVQVIDVQGKRFLIGVGEEVTLLAEVTENFSTEDDETLGDTRFAAALSDALASVRKRYRAKPTKEGQE